MRAGAPKRQNFVLFITDQQRADFLGAYGHPVLRTPHIDGIAARGVSFDRFYVACPVCMPNRATLMTGRMPSAHKVRSNGIPLSKQCTTFVDLLRDAGYFTALVGKSHLQNFTALPSAVASTPIPEDYFAPTSELQEALRPYVAPDYYRQEGPSFWRNENAKLDLPYYGFEHVELSTGHGDEVGGDYERWLRDRNPEIAAKRGPDFVLPHAYRVPQARRTAIPEELYPSSFIAERAEALIGERLSEAEQPFFLMVSFPDPHHPFTPPGKYWDMYDPRDMKVPDAFTKNDWQPPVHVRKAIEERESGRAQLEGTNAFAVDELEAREAQALTCGMITMIDDCVGRVLRALDRAGLTDSTVVIFTSDHGDFLGDHRLMLKGPAHYQSIISVPFIWSDPSAPQTGRRTRALASTLDIGATVLDRARVVPFNGMQGKSLIPVIEGRTESHWASLLIEEEQQRATFGFPEPPRVRTLVDGRWRLSLFHGVDWGELYDLQDDPGEFQNLWDLPSRGDLRNRLIEALVRKQLEMADRSPLPMGRG